MLVTPKEIIKAWTKDKPTNSSLISKVLTKTKGETVLKHKNEQFFYY